MATSAGSPGGWGETYAVAPVALPPAKLRPGRVWYWVALAVFVAGVAWWVVSFVTVIGRVNSFQRVPFPGTGVISLTRGDYVVYYEGRGASSGTVPEGHIHVDSLSESAAGADMTITPHSGSLTYQFGSHVGAAAGTVQIPVSGRYQVQATSSAALRGGHLAFGSSVAGWIVGAVVPAAVVPAAILMLAGVVGAIVVAIIRHKRLERAGQLQLLELAARSLFPHQRHASVRAGSRLALVSDWSARRSSAVKNRRENVRSVKNLRFGRFSRAARRQAHRPDPGPAARSTSSAPRSPSRRHQQPSAGSKATDERHNRRP